MLLSRNISLLIILGVLNSCGFQLRQPVLLPVSMNQTYIETNNNRSLFYQQLKKELVSKDIELVSSKADASSILKIFEDETGRRVLSVSARNIATEYEVFYRIVFYFIEQFCNYFFSVICFNTYFLMKIHFLF